MVSRQIVEILHEVRPRSLWEDQFDATST